MFHACLSSVLRLRVRYAKSDPDLKTILQGTVKGGRRQGRQEEVGRQHQGMDRPGVRQVPEGSGKQGKMEKTGCNIICGAPTTLAVKGLMMMMMILKIFGHFSNLTKGETLPLPNDPEDFLRTFQT